MTVESTSIVMNAPSVRCNSCCMEGPRRKCRCSSVSWYGTQYTTGTGLVHSPGARHTADFEVMRCAKTARRPVSVPSEGFLVQGCLTCGLDCAILLANCRFVPSSGPCNSDPWTRLAHTSRRQHRNACRERSVVPGSGGEASFFLSSLRGGDVDRNDNANKRVNDRQTLRLVQRRPR